MKTSNHNQKRQILSKTLFTNFIKGFITILLFIVASQCTFAQVGIGNTDPKATLDITVVDPDNPLNTDGILVPRVNTLTFTGLNTDQNGMLVYLTTDVTISTILYTKGFYYWDQSTTNWIFIAGAKRINDLDDGISDGSSLFLGNNSGVNDNGNNNQNSGLGIGALQQNTSGQFNTGIGYASLGNNSDGFGNTALGSESLSSNTNGNANTAVGMFSLYSNTTGSGNTAMGFNALQNTTTGGSNVAVGDWAGRYTNGTGNVVVGSSALEQNISGSNNVVIGDHAANQNYNASGSVFIGSFAGYNETNGSRLYIENSDNDPNNSLIYGEFDNKILRTNSEFQIGNPTGTGYAFPTADGTNNQILATNGSGTVSFMDASTVFTSTQNTLDQAYDQGGPGAGRTINATDGQVRIQGSHGLYVSNNSSTDNDDGLYIRKTGSGLSQDALSIEFLGSVSSTSTSALNSINNRIEIDATNSPITGLNNLFILSSNNGYYTGVRNNFYNVSGAFSFLGTRNDFSSNSYSQTGVTNLFGSTVTTEAVGLSNTNIGGAGFFGTGNYLGVDNAFANNVNGRYTYGIKNEISGSGDGEKYGSYTEILASAGGQHYGVYSDVGKATGYAGYFLGRLSIGTTTSDNYILPATRGANGYIIQSTGGDGSDWVDPSTVFTDADNQNISGSGLSGTDLTIGIQNGTNEVVDLSSLQDGVGTDNQTIDELSLSGTILNISLEDDGQATQTLDLSSLGSNTLDQAYDQGGAGVGKTIDATDGAVTISGEDGFLVTGTFGSGNDIENDISGAGTRMYFNPNESVFRAGTVDSNQWVSANSGDYSVAMGQNTMALGSHSLAIGENSRALKAGAISIGIDNEAEEYSSISIGYNNAALGENSVAVGRGNTATRTYSHAFGAFNEAPAYAETTMGIYATTYTASGDLNNVNDRIFSIGNGTGNTTRSNAITIYKNGLMNINDQYDMPLYDGSANQVMATDGAGMVSFVDANSLTGNTLDQAYNQGGSGAGRFINASSGPVHVGGGGGFLVTQSTPFTYPIDSEVTGTGIRMFFNPHKVAFRAGAVTGSHWDDANIGVASVALGNNTLASRIGSTALGDETQATGVNSTAMGYTTVASGSSSTAMGYTTVASGESSTAMGEYTTASGSYSSSIGYYTESPSYAETSIGYFNTSYTPNNVSSINDADRVFSIGNGADDSNRSNALTIYKSGLMNINDEYDMPLTDGLANQIMSTDGAGHVNFVNVATIFNDDQTIDTFNFNTSTNELTLEIEDDGIIAQTIDLSTLDTGGDITAVTAGAGLTGGGTTGALTVTAAANNGLNVDAGSDRIQLGGPLTEDTTITYGAFDTRFNLSDVNGGDFIIQSDGTDKFTVLDNGDTVLGGDLYWRDEDTGGTVIARMIDDDNDGRLQIYENGTASINLDANGASIFNEQGFDRNFRVETDDAIDMFFVDGGADRIGIGTTTPDYRLSVDGTLNLREDAGTGVAMRVEGNEAIYYNTTTQLFSWGFGGTQNYFADDVGIGTNTPAFKLDVHGNSAAGYVAQIYNTNTNANADGLKIRLGRTTVPTSSNSFIAFFDGNGGTGTARGRIQGNGTGVTYNTTSDRRLKTNINDIDNALALIGKMQPRHYEYKSNLGIKEYGFIAQELQTLYPQAVFGSPDSDVTKNPMMVDYGRLTPILAAGIKELKEEVDILKTENAILKAKLNQLETLESRILALENNTETTQTNKELSSKED